MILGPNVSTLTIGHLYVYDDVNLLQLPIMLCEFHAEINRTIGSNYLTKGSEQGILGIVMSDAVMQRAYCVAKLNLNNNMKNIIRHVISTGVLNLINKLCKIWHISDCTVQIHGLKQLMSHQLARNIDKFIFLIFQT